MFIGRFSPLHFGHQQIIDQIKTDGLTPLVIIGSADKLDTRTPWSATEREEMIKLVYPDIIIRQLPDYNCWDKWHTQLLKIFSHSTLTGARYLSTVELSNFTIYTHAKPEDKQDFEFRGVEYTNEYYSKVFEVDGMHVKKIITSDHPVRATMIRENLEKHKQHLHPKVYQWLKQHRDNQYAK